jgi:hypothetical protein
VIARESSHLFSYRLVVSDELNKYFTMKIGGNHFRTVDAWKRKVILESILNI